MAFSFKLVNGSNGPSMLILVDFGNFPEGEAAFVSFSLRSSRRSACAGTGALLQAMCCWMRLAWELLKSGFELVLFVSLPVCYAQALGNVAVLDPAMVNLLRTALFFTAAGARGNVFNVSLGFGRSRSRSCAWPGCPCSES